MLFTEADMLEFGDEMYVADGVGRPLTNKIVAKLAGPFTDGHSKKPPMPKEGETWIHRVDGALRSRYVAGVTTNHVVLKASQERPDSKAHVIPLSDFVRTYKRRA